MWLQSSRGMNVVADVETAKITARAIFSHDPGQMVCRGKEVSWEPQGEDAADRTTANAPT